MPEPDEQSKTQDDKPVVEDKKDDDIEIDFGKITGFFKKKKSEKKEELVATPAEEHEEKKSDEGKSDEIDVGKAFSGIVGAFKSLKSGKVSGGEDGEAVDLSSAINFLSKHYVTLLVILAVVVSVGVGFNLRMQSGNLGFTDNWARSSIQTTLNQDISNFINQQYPNLPDSNRQQLIAEELNKAAQTGTYVFKTGQFTGQTINLQQQIDATSAQFKTFFQDDSGRNYMPDIDPYYWWKYARNILEKGATGD